MTEEENKAIEDLKKILKYWQTIVDIKDDVEREIEMNCYSEEMPFEQLKIALNLIEKLQKENEELRNTKKCCPQFNTSGIKCKNKDIHCPTSKETLDYYENFLIPGYEEKIKKLKKENEELKNKVVKRDNEIIQLEESAEKEFLTKQEVKENYIPKDKIREKLEKIEKEKEQYYAAGQHLMYMLLKNQLKSLLEEEYNI